jgi:hypothetical protein
MIGIILTVVTVAYFSIFALWSFLMCASLSSMIWVSIIGDLNQDPAGYNAFEMLSVLGMCWIPVSLLFAAFGGEYDSGQKSPFQRKSSVWTVLGHCGYYLGLIGVPCLVLPIFPHAFDNDSYRYCLSAAALYLLFLGVANCFQAYLFAKKLTIASVS